MLKPLQSYALVKLDLRLQASNLAVVASIDICLDRVGSLARPGSAWFSTCSVRKPTGGILSGSSTSLTSFCSPSFRGHSLSTFFICSQRSSLRDRILIRPYLTSMKTYAPSSISSKTSPVASIARVVPLCSSVSTKMSCLGKHRSQVSRAGRVQCQRRAATTYALGGLGSRSTLLMSNR